MAYPKKAKGENTNADNMATAPGAPQVATVAAPQVTGARGGAPRIGREPPAGGDMRVSAVKANNALRSAWDMTGSNSAMYDRTFQRTQLGADPGVVAGSLRDYWAGAAAGGGGSTPLPTPSGMPLEDAQKYLADLSASMKKTMDERLKALPAGERDNSRFWRAYQQYPEQMATMVARRVWTGQLVGQGPVADWLKWLEG